METFSYQLEQIHQKISIKDEDRKPYTELFDTVKNWLTNAMCDIDPLFKELFKGTELFGSYSNNVRILKPSEFDVSILLELPFSINADFNRERIGFVVLSSAHWKNELNGKKYSKFFNKDNCLSSTDLQNWIKDIIEIALETKPLPSPRYNIKHRLCKVAQKICAKDTEKCITISIDFVPSIVMEKFSITPLNKTNKLRNMKSFLAVPNGLVGFGPQSCREDVFQIVNQTEERKLLWNKNNLKIIYRLLKSMRDNQKLPRLKSYFLCAVFLLEVEEQQDDFWLKPVGDLFIYMMKKLHGYFQSGNLPYYWDLEFNLLSIFKEEELSDYAKTLQDVYCKLEKISLQKSVALEQVASFFKTSY